MPTLKDVVAHHLEATGQSVRALAGDAGLGYQIVLGVVNRGSLPRKAEHREALRKTLGIDEERWAQILVDSATADVAPQRGGKQQGLQQMVSQAMYAKGLTEQQLAKLAGVAYSTVMGITRKGAIPRTDSLRKLSKALKLDQDEVRAAAALSRAARRNPEVTRSHHKKVDERNLAQMVADLIQQRRQSTGAFARDVGIGYLTLSQFLESGVPPEDQGVLTALRQSLAVDTETFQVALDRSQQEPEPAHFAPKDDLLGIDANALQKALVGYMREQNLTLKALAKKADLSQVTVSRLVKQGQSPTRATTHLKLQELLGLEPDDYQKLTVGQTMDELPALEAADDHEPGTDSYLPHSLDQLPLEDFGLDASRPPTKDELIGLVKKLGPSQREALRKFLSTLV